MYWATKWAPFTHSSPSSVYKSDWMYSRALVGNLHIVRGETRRSTTFHQVISSGHKEIFRLTVNNYSGRIYMPVLPATGNI